MRYDIKVIVSLALIFAVLYLLFSFGQGIFLPQEKTPTTTTSTTSTSTSTTSTTSTSTSISTSTSSTTTTTTTTSTTTTSTVPEFILNRDTPIIYRGYEIHLRDIILTDTGEKYLLEIKTPDNATDNIEIYDKFVIDALEFGVLERLSGFDVKFYIKDYASVLDKKPQYSKALSVGGKNFNSFEREFMDYKFKYHNRRLEIEKPNGRRLSAEIPENGSIFIDNFEIGYLQPISPGGYTIIFIKSAYTPEFSEQLYNRSFYNLQKTFGVNLLSERFLKNPAHNMQEKSGNFVYSVDLDYIPMEDIYGGDGLIDTKWRGRILFGGEEFYVMDIDPEGEEIYLSKGKFAEISNREYLEYLGYGIRINGLEYDEIEGNGRISIIVRCPNNYESIISITPDEIAVIDEFMIDILSVINTGRTIRANITIHPFFPLVILQNNKTFPYRSNWITKFGIVNVTESINITEYENATRGRLLKNITIFNIK